jgi:hypothetical protein
VDSWAEAVDEPSEEQPPAGRDPRRQSYWELHDFASGRGLEVGPLHRPLVAKDEAAVEYLDVMDRARLLEHYADDPFVTPEAVPEIDHFLIGHDGHSRSLLEAVGDAEPFNWVLASHVIEHIPNPIGWLEQLATLTVDDGVLVLAVPDRRYCFDVLRPATTTGQLLAAHHNDDQRPPVAAVYDYFVGSVTYDATELWRGEVPSYASRIHGVDQASERVAATLAGEYVDCHVWLFTPQSFVEQMHELRAAGLSKWYVEQIEATPEHDIEFKVVMRRLPRGTDSTAPCEGEVLSDETIPDWMAATAEAHDLRAEVLRLSRALTTSERYSARLERRLTEKTARLGRLRQTVQRQERRLLKSRDELQQHLAEPRGVLASMTARTRGAVRSVLRRS